MLCESSSERLGGATMSGHSDRIEERIYKSLWHVLIAAVGVYELRNHKTKISKVLACGLIAFHVDAAIADVLDTPTLSRRILEQLRPNDNSANNRSPKK
jgi:hypothetical protein